MSDAIPSERSEDGRILLGLLTSVEEGATSQRRIASDLGIALGLVNAYLKRCVRKGLVKVSEAPTRRYAYYLTPRGFTEKSRLTVEYLSLSFSFFRQARADCVALFADAKKRNFQNMVLCGRSELAEVAILAALDNDITIVAVVDPDAAPALIGGKVIVTGYDAIPEPFDAVVITDMRNSRVCYDDAVRRLGADRVWIPRLLGLSVSRRQEESQ